MLLTQNISQQNTKFLWLAGTYLVEDLKSFIPKDDPNGSLAPVHSSFNSLKNEVQAKCHVTISIFIDIFIRGDYNISCLSKFIGNLHAYSNEISEYIGPVFRDESKLNTFDVDPGFLENNDIIYVSLGTVFPNKQGFVFYDNIIKALGETEHKLLILAPIDKVKELSDKGLPKNIILKSWVPQMKVLEHSKLFISHVGAGSMIEAIHKGVPIMIVLTLLISL